MDLLLKAKVFKQVSKTSGESVPLNFHASNNHFKVIFLDVGLMHNLLDLSKDILVEPSIYNLASGALTEQVAGQELLAHQSIFKPGEMYFWERDGRNISAEKEIS